MPANLKRRYQTWYARLTIPSEVRDQFNGKTEFVESLKTDSLREAQRLLGTVLGRWRTRIEEARASEPDRRYTLSLQRAIEDARRRGDEDAEFAIRGSAEEHAEQLARTHDYQTARQWYDLATGQGTDIAKSAEEWLSENHYEGKSVTMHRQAIRLLVDFEPIAENIDRRTAARFVSEIMRPNRSPTTVTKIISTYSQLWRWLADRGYIEDPTIWSRQQPRKSHRQGRKRAEDFKPTRRLFTDSEARAMFEAVDALANKHPADPLAVRLIAVTGMRLNEVCLLRTGNVSADGETSVCIWLYVDEGKTRSAIRLAPVVDEIVVAMLRPRLKDRKKDKSAWFFPEYTPKNKLGNRSAPLSQRLRRYRNDRIGADPTVVGGHSWRHRARKAVEIANLRTRLINAYFGHNLDTEDRDYIHSKTERQELIRVAEALRLPERLQGFPVNATS